MSVSKNPVKMQTLFMYHVGIGMLGTDWFCLTLFYLYKKKIT